MLETVFTFLIVLVVVVSYFSEEIAEIIDSIRGR